MAEKPGTVGKPTAATTSASPTTTATPLPDGEVGTVYLKAPDGGRFEYYKDAEKTAASYRGDYFTLGDVGYLDDDGYLFLTDRSANLIISGGVNIYPAEVERCCSTHPAVGDVGDDRRARRRVGRGGEGGGRAARPASSATPELAERADRVLPRRSSRTTSARARSTSSTQLPRARQRQDLQAPAARPVPRAAATEGA